MKFLPLILLTVFSGLSSAQVQLKVEVITGNATTTCTDLFSSPDPLWQVNINNQGWETYPRQGNCFNSLPNTQFSELYSCPSDLPASVEVCFKVFENDGLIGCNMLETCSETICVQYPIPPLGSVYPFTLALPAGFSSAGSVELELMLSGNFTGGQNDLICDAVDLGLLDIGMRLGNAQSGGFSNQCAGATGDPNPAAILPNAWQNESGVWFTFITNTGRSGPFDVRVLSDPVNAGDPIDAQVAVFESLSGTCTGNLNLLTAAYDSTSPDENVSVFCSKPNTRYFILVDGEGISNQLDKGTFGIEIVHSGAQEGGDRRCDAFDLGTVPEGGVATTPFPQTNYCATAIGDPPVSAFVSQRSVYYKFVPPASGHVLIEAISDLTDSIGTQIAVYRAHNNLCTGFFSQVASYYTEADLDEKLELSCLTPGRPYFILIDGDAYNTFGIFEIKVTDLGDDTPILQVKDTICAGDFLQVGWSTYLETGIYADTFLLPGGCDSVVLTDLTVLEPLQLNIFQVDRALGDGSPTGSAIVTATGGTGRYSIRWANGDTANFASGLEGGDYHCVQVTDSKGCAIDTCIYIEFIHPILPQTFGSSLKCNGDSNGSISFSVSNGVPPYQFIWQSTDHSANGSGSLISDNEMAEIKGLRAGIYEITVTDVYTDTIFKIEVRQPDPVQVLIDELKDASCYKFCDGELSIRGVGGVGGYWFTWQDGKTTPDLNGLCAGTYRVTVTDANACVQAFETEVTQPAEFIALAVEESPVSCFGGNDGKVYVATNGNPVRFEWNTGQNSQTLLGLPSGKYDVTVTNADQCKDTASVIINQPAEPVRAEIELLKRITCHGDADGALMAIPAGPGVLFHYRWSDNSQGQMINNLSAGWYQLTLTNEKGCLTVDSFLLDQAPPLEIAFETKNLNCNDPPDGGQLQVISVQGGEPGYAFSLDGIVFSDDRFIRNLYVGSYDLILKDALGCEKQYPFYIFPPPDLTVELGSDRILDLGDELVLRASANSINVVYTWEGLETFPCTAPSCSEQSFLPLADGLIRVTVKDTFTYCEAIDSIYLQVNKNYNVFIPNAFSPNDDGINDELLVYAGRNVKVIRSFRIFDRYGSLLFERKNFAPNEETLGWDGRINNQRLQTGVYVFVAEIEFIDGKVEWLKGDLTLVR